MDNLAKNLKGKRILIFQQRGWAFTVGELLAEKLQAEGCRLAALTFKKSTHQYLTEEQKKIKYEYVLNVDELYEEPEVKLGQADISFKDICRELKIDSLWPLIYTNRLLVRSYGEKFYYSCRQNTPDDYIVTHEKLLYVKIRELFEKFKPEAVIIASFVFEGHIFLQLLCEKSGIPLITVDDSKVPGYYIFTSDYLTRKGEVFGRFDALQNGAVKSENAAKARDFIARFKKKLIKPIPIEEPRPEGIIKKIRHELWPYRRIWEWYFKKGARFNNIKGIGPTLDYNPPKIVLRNFYSGRRYARYAENFKYYPFDKVKKFIFYPLQFSPEASADMTCPLYNNQVEGARQIAMSMPDDYTLVVKEHPNMIGVRTPAYTEKIARTANVKLIDYRISSEEVLRRADLVISPYSTTLFEAAFYYKPAILLSDVGIFSLLPNVFRHRDMSTLTEKIKELLALDLKNEKYDRQLENYVAAVFDTGCELNYSRAWERGGKELDKIWAIWKKELLRVIK